MNHTTLLHAFIAVHADATLHRESNQPSGRFYADQGICNNVSEYMPPYVDSSVFKSLFVSWQHFSGSWLYPVPSTVPTLTHGGMYHYTDDVWVGEYGNLRMDLLNHCIKTLERSDT